MQGKSKRFAQAFACKARCSVWINAAQEPTVGSPSAGDVTPATGISIGAGLKSEVTTREARRRHRPAQRVQLSPL